MDIMYVIGLFRSSRAIGSLKASRYFSVKASEQVTSKREDRLVSAGKDSSHTTPASKERLIKVAIIGVPNAGKSTLINHLINHRVCPTSMKVHTTRDTAKAVHNRSNSQMILFDTPGLVGDREIKKHQLGSGFLSACRHAIQNSNLIGVVHDVSNSWTRNTLNPILLNVLKEHTNIPSFLILNKIDTLKSKRALLDIVRNITNNELENIKNYHIKKRKSTPTSKKEPESEGWSNFSQIFMVSAITGDGLKEVMDFIYSHAKLGSWEHLASETTDQSPEQLIIASVRARLLDYLPQEIPYNLQTELEFYENIKGKIFASAVVTCPSQRIERLVCGEGNGKLRQITERVTSDLIETFAVSVSLTISTRVKSKE
ncbi:GTPase Era, mitochondrial-like [Uranotaenia lowii]|uniref:GTPase Era, mitochondrial-like n=1 Tax=Uranotaenia lowii TaxID=190385 RepID=UPI00247AA102|nr:GTPase Era, mitochondrial-like [Uranotaenia lowii]XP_055597183.1 GTPase Era, mitochondrial-like [Uranotaenia lowii]